jgi:tripartite-type tricarboxylate transporter receptor subunit TctC
MRLLPRRTFLQLAASAAVLPAMPRLACAQAYPTRPARIIVGFPAGGTTDIVGRLVGQWLSEHLGQQFVVENRPGASANIATEAVARATADGYTLLMLGAGHTINAALFDKLNFDFVRDIAPIASIIDTPLLVGQSIGSGQDNTRVCLCQGQRGQDQPGNTWHRNAAPCGR